MADEYNYPRCLTCGSAMGYVKEMLWLPCFHEVICNSCCGKQVTCVRGCQPVGYYYRHQIMRNINASIPYPEYNNDDLRVQFADFSLNIARFIRGNQPIPGLEQFLVMPPGGPSPVVNILDLPLIDISGTVFDHCEHCGQPLAMETFRCAECSKVNFTRCAAALEEKTKRAKEMVEDIISRYQT